MKSISAYNPGELSCLANTVRAVEQIGTIGKPCQLCIGNRSHIEEFDSSDLATLIGGIACLGAIKLYQGRFVGDFSLLTNALSRCEDLVSFQSLFFELNPSPCHVAALAQALAKLPRLKKITIRTYWYRYSNSSLLPYEVIMPAVQRSNNVLREISVSNYFAKTPDAERRCNRWFVRFLEACQNCSNLQELTIGAERINDYLEPFVAYPLDAAGQLIQKTSSLTKLVIWAHPSTSRVVLAEALKANRSLKALHINRIWHQGPDGRAQAEEVAAFCTALEHNFALEELMVHSLTATGTAYESASSWEKADSIGDINPRLQSSKARRDLARVDFFLSLNKAGRAKLMGAGPVAATVDDWWEVIANQDDLSVIYYFLRANPSLCRPTNRTEKPVDKATKQMQRSLAAWLATAPKADPRPRKRQRKEDAPIQAESA